MKRKLFRIDELEHILRLMKQWQAEHPKAEVIFDIEEERVEIIYPLPREFYKLSKTK